ncbi:uncharacterized protein LOC113240515 [Hyposmocoma kahamanoa]|uniref:uncharacterized protein LOC113240515 n=1 Tax=Hyposmocoma kahamanoa TaxID=1477025 RepID=UPI000E6D8F74|nr:uncharacterized protein LOC113240515 [Hyposmocoma kahamanoa]
MEDIEEIIAEEDSSATRAIMEPLTFVLHFLASYGWMILATTGLLLFILHKMKPRYYRWKEAQEDAAYHKDPDTVLSRLEAIQRARMRQQETLESASERAKEAQKQREEAKRREAIARIEKYGAAGRRLGTPDDADYMPLSGGASTSTYRPPKRSACAGGGCGK